MYTKLKKQIISFNEQIPKLVKLGVLESRISGDEIALRICMMKYIVTKIHIYKKLLLETVLCCGIL